MLAWPSLTIFDLDHTLWHRPRFSRGPPFTLSDGGLSGVTSACGKKLDLYDGARRALITLADHDVPVALVSRTHRQVWASEWLEKIKIDPERTIMDVVAPSLIVFQDGAKTGHVREINRRMPLIPFS